MDQVLRFTHVVHMHAPPRYDGSVWRCEWRISSYIPPMTFNFWRVIGFRTCGGQKICIDRITTLHDNWLITIICKIILNSNLLIDNALTWITVCAITRATGGSRITSRQPRRFGKLSCRSVEHDRIICMGNPREVNPSQSIKTVIWGFWLSTRCKTPNSTCDTAFRNQDHLLIFCGGY